MTTLELRARPVSPYKGLASFEDSELDELLFFGREREREVVAANLVAARLTVLYGPSGVGKSSLLAAGVARDLRALPERPLVVVHGAWADDPAAALVQAVTAAAGVEAATLADAVELATALHGELFLLLDQIEEYFTYHGSDPALGDLLAELVARPELPLHVLLGVREDALARLDAFKSRLPGLLANRLRLEHLSRDAGRRAILGPIERFAELVPEEEGLAVEPEVVEAVLDGVRAGAFARAAGGVRRAETVQRVETPYLQVVMQRLWEVERAEGSRVIRLATLERLGGPARIVEEHLERALAALTPAQKELAARMFNHLVTPSGTKIAYDDEDLAGYVHAAPEELAPVLDALGRERILRPVDAGHEIFHDVLAEAVLAWRGRFEAERALEREIAASRRRHRRLLAIVAGAGVLAAVMAALAVWALTQRHDAQQNAAAAQASAQEARRQERKAAQQTAVAETERQKAEQAAAEANEQAAKAKQEQQKADAAAKQAQEQQAIAEQQKSIAQQQQAIAEAQRVKAQQASLAALAARRVALQRQQEAKRQARIALAQRASALAQKRVATANADAARALSLIDVQPVAGLRSALAAIAIAPTAAHVDVLRQAIVHDRLRAVLPGGGGRVESAVPSPDGSLVVTTAEQGGARLFRSDGKLLRALGPARGASFSPDGSLIATWGADGARLERPVGRAAAVTLPAGPVHALAFSQDGRLVATAGDGAAKVWTPDGSLVATLPHDGSVLSVAFGGSGARVLTVAEDSAGRLQARIFDARTGALLQLLNARGIRAAAFSPDGALVATASNDHTERLWNAATGAELQRMTEDGQLVATEFSRDGKLLVAANAAGGAAIWDVPSGTLHAHLVGTTNRVIDASFSPDARFVVIASLDRTARVFRTSDGLQAALLADHADSVTSAVFGPTDRMVVTASDDGTAHVWDTGVGDLLRPLGTHAGAAPVARFSPDGRLAVSAGADKTAVIWRLAGGSVVLRHDGAVQDAVFSQDGKLVATGAADGTARVWRSSDGVQLQVVKPGTGVNAVALSPDGRTLAVGAADSASLWRVADGGQLRVLSMPKPVRTVAFSPDGRSVAFGSDDGTVRLWGSGGARVLRAGAGAVERVAFSPDGTRLAAADADASARLWSVPSGRPIAVLAGHSLAVNDVEWSLDGRLLVTASLDSDARLWDGRTGKLVGVLRGHFGDVEAASFSPDGRWVVTAGPFTAGIWQTSTGKLFAPTGSVDPYLRGPAQQLTSASFAPDGRRILVSSRDGSVRTYLCTACGGVRELVPLAKALLRDGGPH